MLIADINVFNEYKFAHLSFDKGKIFSVITNNFKNRYLMDYLF